MVIAKFLGDLWNCCKSYKYLCNCLQLKGVFVQLLEFGVISVNMESWDLGFGLGQCYWFGLKNFDVSGNVYDWTKICSEAGLGLVREINRARWFKDWKINK